MGYAPPYYLRLRIYAKQVNYFYRKLRALPPVYDNCPVRCLAPEADRVNGCPDCSFQVYYRTLRDNYNRIVEKEIRRSLIEGGLPEADATRIAKDETLSQWSFENVQDDYRGLSEIEAVAGTETAEAPGGIDPTWSVRVRTAIDIIREERYKIRREIEYEDKQKLDAERRAREARGRR